MAVNPTCDIVALERVVDEVVSEYIAPDGPGLSILIGRDDKVLLKKGYGLADVSNRRPVTPDTQFLIGSVTKQFTCIAIMMLKHRGLLDYDEPLARFFPDFPPYSNIVTIRHLMTHTSGIKEYLTEQFWKEITAGKRYTQESLIEHIRDLGDLQFQPGEKWRYCNSGYILLGAIVEKASGESFAEFLQKNVFDPLGMNSTLVGTSGDRLPREAVGYSCTSKGEFKEEPYNMEVVGWADGNVISTVEDLFTWAQALYTDRLLPYEVISEAFVPCNPLDPSFSRYGFGHLISERRGIREVHHGGTTLGYVARFGRFTDERLAIIILSNAAGVDLGEIYGAIAGFLLSNKMAPVRPVSIDYPLLAEKSGEYEDYVMGNPSVLTVKYDKARDCLSVSAKARAGKGSWTLTPVSVDLFRVDNRSEMYIQFLRDHGRVSGARLIVNGFVQNFVKNGSIQGT